MSRAVLASLNIHDRFRVKELRGIKEYSSSPENASDLFDLIVSQLASCNSQNCEPETIYKNAMAIGDFWGLGAEDFKRRVAESQLEAETENWFFRAFIGGAKFSRNTKDARTHEEKAVDLEKLKQLAGLPILSDEKKVGTKVPFSAAGALEASKSFRGGKLQRVRTVKIPDSLVQKKAE